MMKANDFRRIALGLEGAIESAHMGHPDFRANGRIFATLKTDMESGMVKLTPDEQQHVHARPSRRVFRRERRLGTRRMHAGPSRLGGRRRARRGDDTGLATDSQSRRSQEIDIHAARQSSHSEAADREANAQALSPGNVSDHDLSRS